ncbi:hypothetical protein FRC17_001837 [Serendipita sp. 399]|nr:hypothetical protein FRC17_001837 [Serendipita sp. 399]
MLHGKPMASPKSTSPQLPTGSISVDQQPVLGNHARSRSPVRAQELDGSSIFFRIEGNGFIPTVDVESSAGINNRPLGQHTLGEMDPRERGRSTKRVPNPAKSGSSLVDRIEDHESNQIYPVDGSRTPLVQRLGVEAGLLAARIQRSSAGSSTQRRPYPTDFEKRIKP